MKKQQKCYIYTRASTSMQVEGYSLDAQKDKLNYFYIMLGEKDGCH